MAPAGIQLLAYCICNEHQSRIESINDNVYKLYVRTTAHFIIILSIIIKFLYSGQLYNGKFTRIIFKIVGDILEYLI